MCENRELRRIFGPKREEVTGGWRKFIMKVFVMFTLHELYKMITASMTRDEKCVYNFSPR
jgi:hypothetical protein